MIISVPYTLLYHTCCIVFISMPSMYVPASWYSPLHKLEFWMLNLKFFEFWNIVPLACHTHDLFTSFQEMRARACPQYKYGKWRVCALFTCDPYLIWLAHLCYQLQSIHWLQTVLKVFFTNWLGCSAEVDTGVFYYCMLKYLSAHLLQQHTSVNISTCNVDRSMV